MLDDICRLPEPLQTPLIEEDGIRIKVEGRQRTGSVKYRLVYAKICAALEKGAIDSRTLLVEASSGSTGIALAYAGRKVGCPVEIHALQSASPEKCDKIRRSGARLVLHPADTSPRTVFDLISSLLRKGAAWHLNQYDRTSFPGSYQSLAEELIRQHRQKDLPPPTRFVCATGTGGVVQGVGSHLRKAFPGIEVVSVEPERGAVIDGMRNRDEHSMGEADPFDPAFPDQRMTVSPPRGNAQVQRMELGESATAIFRLIRRKGWKKVLMIAPD